MVLWSVGGGEEEVFVARGEGVESVERAEEKGRENVVPVKLLRKGSSERRNFSSNVHL